MPQILETDVLVVGSGPAGSAAAALLSSYGVKNVQITKYGWLSDTPRAHITNQRTMEVLRDLGVEHKAKQFSSHQHLMANNVFCYSLTGEEFGRILSWGNHPARKADYELASPTEICDLPQTFMEPILLEAAVSRGTALRLNTEFIELVQDGDGVTATVKDRLTGETYPIRCKYLIGADGGRSKVAEAIGLPMEGQMGLSGSMNILFDADLSRYVAHRPSVLYWVLQPGANIGGIGAGVLRMVRPWNEWLAIWGYDISGGELKLTEEKAEAIVRNLIGDVDVPIKIRSTSTWTVNEVYATRYSEGRVFCMGDAVHRHPPLNGLGSNTSIQDAYNLAWKLKLVLDNKADESLLDTYSVERQPIGKQIVTRANKSIADYPPIFEALGLLASTDPEQVNAAIAGRKDATAEGKGRRRKLNDAIARKNYEFNTHGVELNQRYRSAAVVSDGSPEPAYVRDPELYYHATTWPGATVPHVWVEHDRVRKSTLDLCGKGRFTLLTGIGGEEWRDAATTIEKRFGVAVDVVSIGPSGCDALDIYADWYWRSEVEEDGCVLVRPDQHVAWRAATILQVPQGALVDVFAKILGRSRRLASTKARTVESVN
ncbi:FAD-dependent monooxygenase [Mesorhizobium sp. M0621]|uniref:FAD-dependent oxidoreductase n=1 Tax=Mesorhizobium sp. M0621 TaxID=2956974 RepID=UPI00333996CC